MIKFPIVFSSDISNYIQHSSDASTTRPSVPSFDLTRSSLSTRFNIREMSRSSVRFEGFDDVEVLPRKYTKPFSECPGNVKKLNYMYI